MLVALFLLRPSAHAALRSLLHSIARIASGRQGLASAALRSWSASAIEMIEHLETAIWARYFRTGERIACSADG